MELDDPAGTAALGWLDPAMDAGAGSGAEAAVGALYRAQAVGLIRLAYLMLGDRAAAEDVVQDAFCGLYRRWDRLADPGSALPYVRSSVLNGCRTALRRRALGRRVTEYQPPSGSAEAAVLSRPQAGPGGIPAYYVALITTAKPQSDVANDLGSSSLAYSAAELRSTQTGAVLARITPPGPYVSFTGVTGAADDRTFVLSAQGPEPAVWPPFPAQRFFLLRIAPAARAGARMTLTALPAGYVPAGYGIREMALSPDGTRLAAGMGESLGYAEELDVFDLATGTERAWSTRTCAECAPNGGGNLWMGANPDALSWTADSRHVAFTWGNTVRLLDTRAAGSDLLTNSKTVATWTGGVTGLNQWRGAIITPDGRTVLGVEQLGGMNLKGPIREHLVSWSAATGQQIAVLNNLNARKLGDYEQILYTSADGSVLVLTYQRPGAKAAIVHDGRSTPIPWSPYIGAAAW